MNEYRESILLELKERSVVEHNMFLNAKYHFENENHLYLKLDDTIVAQGKQDSIVAVSYTHLDVYKRQCVFRLRYLGYCCFLCRHRGHLHQNWFMYLSRIILCQRLFTLQSMFRTLHSMR